MLKGHFIQLGQDGISVTVTQVVDLAAVSIDRYRYALRRTHADGVDDDSRFSGFFRSGYRVVFVVLAIRNQDDDFVLVVIAYE